MPKSKYFARIAITLPEADLRSADDLAKRLDRSRSWVVAEAVRRFATAERVHGEPIETAYSSTTSGSSAAEPLRPGLGDSRRAQLISDLKLTPEARVRAGEETLRLTNERSRPRTQQLAVFDRYEDFLDWKRRRSISP